MLNLPTGTLQSSWITQYGPVLRYTSIMRRPEVMLADPQAIKYIYDHPELFRQTDSAQNQALNLTGKSLLWSMGDDHKRMRKAILPSFGPAHLRELVSVFRAKATEARDRMEQGETDMAKLVNQITTGVIGMAGFNHEFGSLSEEKSELLDSWRAMLMGFRDRSFLAVLQYTGVIGIIRIWVSEWPS